MRESVTLCRLMTPNICDLPQDCLRLILSKVDFGGEKQVVWAVSGSCKPLQQAVKACPADVSLCGRWSRRQLLGLTSVLPEMASLLADCPKAPNSFNRTEEVKQIYTWMGQSHLTRLNLRDVHATFLHRDGHGTWHEAEGFAVLPKGLLHLTMPRSMGTEEVEIQVNNLARLTRLECCDPTPIWPSPGLIGLKDLSFCTDAVSIGRGLNCANPEWFKYTLKQLTNLTRLDLTLRGDVQGAELPLSIQELILSGPTIYLRQLAPSITTLRDLTRLELHKPVWENDGDEGEGHDMTADEGMAVEGDKDGEDEDDDGDDDDDDVELTYHEGVIDLSGVTFHRLREMVVVGFQLGFPVIRAPNLASLSLSGLRERHEGPWLRASTIARISAMTTIRELKLSHWETWDDIQPLAAFTRLERFETNQGLALLDDLLRAGCLHSVVVVKVWVSRLTTNHYTPLQSAAVENALLALPRLRVLSGQLEDLLPAYLMFAEWVDSFFRLLVSGVGDNGSRWRCLYSEELMWAYRRKWCQAQQMWRSQQENAW